MYASIAECIQLPVETLSCIGHSSVAQRHGVQTVQNRMEEGIVHERRDRNGTTEQNYMMAELSCMKKIVAPRRSKRTYLHCRVTKHSMDTFWRKHSLRVGGTCCLPRSSRAATVAGHYPERMFSMFMPLPTHKVYGYCRTAGDKSRLHR